MRISKKKRKEVYEKCGGHCAYCGDIISFDNFQVDHIIPLRFWYITEPENAKEKANDIKNLLPACYECNHYKRALDLETFRNKWLGKLHLRIKKIPKNPRTDKGRKRKEYMQKILDKYKITENTPFNKVFYFEKNC